MQTISDGSIFQGSRCSNNDLNQMKLLANLPPTLLFTELPVKPLERELVSTYEPKIEHPYDSVRPKSTCYVI